MIHPEIYTYFDDKEAWKQRFLRPEAISKEWDMMVEEIAPDVYQFPLFKEELCAKLIECAEATQKWTHKRHAFYPTTDMLVETFGFDDIYMEILDEYIMGAARHIYELAGGSWDMGNIYSENFIIRYSPEEQGHLSLHYDQSKISCNVALNEDFEGGGTYFSRHKKLAKPKGTGYVTIHPGQITHKHGGMPVNKGTRYIIVSFMNEDKQREEHIKSLEEFADRNGYYDK
jgi:hypothetical protein